MVNTQARLLAFIDVFWALQLLALAGAALLIIRTGRPILQRMLRYQQWNVHR